jgi:hypothetical protein
VRINKSLRHERIFAIVVANIQFRHASIRLIRQWAKRDSGRIVAP